MFYPFNNFIGGSMKTLGRIEINKQADPNTNHGTRIVGRIKINKPARYVGPLTDRPFSNLRTLLASKKYADKSITIK